MANYNAIRYNHDFLGQGGNLVLLSTFTSDGSDSNAIFDNTIITDAYNEYLFIFNNLHPQNNATYIRYYPSIDNGSNYNLATQTSFFYAYHREDGANGTLEYATGQDSAGGSSPYIGGDVGSEADECASGFLRLYNPSSTTFVKHFTAKISPADGGSGTNTYNFTSYVAGYTNTTSAINNVKFDFHTGEIQAGTIQVFGVV